MVATILNDKGLKAAWRVELAEMRGRLREMRVLLNDALRARAPDHDFTHLVRARGMFCFLGIPESQVDRLKAEYDLVIVDTPPVMAVADARIIGRVVDKTLFVVRWDKTPRKVARAAVEQLRRADVDIAGVVLQQVDLDRYGRVGYGDSGYYYHYGRYGKYYSG